MKFISFLHKDYTLAKKEDAELIRIVENNGDVQILLVPEEGIGNLDLTKDDVIISADTFAAAFPSQKKEHRHVTTVGCKNSS
jgi:hypothetical protein